MPFVTPQTIPSIEECTFYHAMDLPGVGTVGGSHVWDLRGRVEEYTGNIDLNGKSFLDVGAAIGFISFEVERRGAEVVSFDMEDGQWQIVPTLDAAGSPDRAAKTRVNIHRTVSRIKNGYWLAHAAYSSRARAYYGNIYDISPELGDFDVVFTGQVLVHVRDPLWALYQAAQRCRDTLVITEGMYEDNQPRAVFLSPPGSNNDYSWWHLSPKLYEAWLATIGFEIQSRSSASYPYVTPQGAIEHQIGTIVAKRVSDRYI